MNTQKIKTEEITIENLVCEMLNLPQGWHQEVYVENGEVIFSEPLTQNSWVGKSDAPSEQLDSYIGKIESLSIGDFQGLYKREDGTYEREADGKTDVYNVDGKVITGECYEQAEIISFDDVTSIIAEKLDFPDSPTMELITKIQEA